MAYTLDEFAVDCRRLINRRDSTLGQRPLAGSQFHQQLHLQPYQPLRPIESRLREGRFPRRNSTRP